MKNTPAPWVAGPGGIVLGGPLIEKARGRAMSQVALVVGHEHFADGEREANQAIITLAPDAIEILREIANQRPYLLGDFPITEGVTVTFELSARVCNSIRDVLLRLQSDATAPSIPLDEPKA